MSRDTLFFFFFFQAEDGIRDYKVTGVQTCALPISADHKAAVVAAEHAVGRSCDCHFDIRERLLGRTVDDLPRDGAGRVLSAERYGPEQRACDQRGNDVTDQLHTSALYWVGSGVSPSLTASTCQHLLR